MVAAASRCRRVDDGVLGPWLVANEARFQAVGQTSAEQLKWKRGGRPSARDAVGTLAAELRETFCNEAGLMVTQPLAATYWPFYAALQGSAATFEAYVGVFTYFAHSESVSWQLHEALFCKLRNVVAGMHRKVYR